MKLGFTSLGCSENQNEVSLESNFHRVQIANKILALKGEKKKEKKRKKRVVAICCSGRLFSVGDISFLPPAPALGDQDSRASCCL